ncbi:MAG: GNAT family N-acetyltransferase [Nanoarchaeota archaeon]|nr:GNAT family N-acetyltransferase [Nanoarchaeota archaeon]
MISIKRVPASKWKQYKALRLEALKNDPHSFGNAIEDEIDYPEKEWRRQIRDVLFAVNKDKLVGMIVFKIQTKVKVQHVANIYAMYVKKEYRRKGIASQLINAAIEKIKENPNVEKVKLAADALQKPAIALYKKHGFKETALMKKELKYKGKYFDDVYMEKWIR